MSTSARSWLFREPRANHFPVGVRPTPRPAGRKRLPSTTFLRPLSYKERHVSNRRAVLTLAVLCLFVATRAARSQASAAENSPAVTPPAATSSAVALPEGVKAVWDLDKAYRETTPTRERISINGLWRWQPAEHGRRGADGELGLLQGPRLLAGNRRLHAEGLPDGLRPSELEGRGPGRALPRPGISARSACRRSGRAAAIALALEYLNSSAAVYVDGKKAGEIQFPAGEVDLTAVCRPGSKHVLSLLRRRHAAPGRHAHVQRHQRGQAGEEPGGAARPVRRRLPGRHARRRADRRREGRHVGPQGRDHAGRRDRQPRRRTPAIRSARRSPTAAARSRSSPASRSRPSDLKDGRVALTEKWKPEKLWDIHTPQNQYEVAVSLVDDGGKRARRGPAGAVRLPRVLDRRPRLLPQRHAHLPLRAAAGQRPGRRGRGQLRGGEGEPAAAEEHRHQLRLHPQLRLRAGHAPELRRRSCGPPTTWACSWPSRSRTSASTTGRRPTPTRTTATPATPSSTCAWRGSHPSVVFYSMSHNATGYAEDMNPDMIDGIHSRREPVGRTTTSSGPCGPRRSSRGSTRAASSTTTPRATSSSMHTSNFYPNFAPIQELADWFEHWATAGREAGLHLRVHGAVHLGLDDVPRVVQGQRGSSAAPRCRGSSASPSGTRSSSATGPTRSASRRRRTSAGRPSSSAPAGSGTAGTTPTRSARRCSTSQHAIIGQYLADNWRAFRTWGVSANLALGAPLLLEAARRRRQEPQGAQGRLGEPAAAGLQPRLHRRAVRAHGPGLRAVGLGRRRPTGRPSCATTCRCWPTSAASRRPSPARTTTSRPGETVEKQLIVINNSRQTVTCDCRWSLGLPQAVAGAPEGHACRPASRSAFRCSLQLPADAGAGQVRARRDRPVQQRRDAEGHASRST